MKSEAAKEWLYRVLLVLVSTAFTYLVLEVGYRVVLYQRRVSNPPAVPIRTVDKPVWVFDEVLGYTRVPDQDVHHRIFDEENTLLVVQPFHINNLGLVSPKDDQLDKPDGVFRIVALGDSMTATLSTETPWPSVLEDQLNADEELKAYLNVDRFDVLNFGMEGTGIVQFTGIYEHAVQPYEPDMVIVNFIDADIDRRFVWRDTLRLDSATLDYQVVLNCSSLPVALDNPECVFSNAVVTLLESPDEIAVIKQELYDYHISELSWFSLRPELLIRVLGGSFGIHSQLDLRSGYLPRYGRAEGHAASLAALQHLNSQNSRVLVLYQPILSEMLEGTKQPRALELIEALQEEGIAAETMFDILPGDDEAEVESWFNEYPSDHHWTNYGASVYAEAVHGLIRAYLTQE